MDTRNKTTAEWTPVAGLGAMWGTDYVQVVSVYKATATVIHDHPKMGRVTHRGVAIASLTKPEWK